MMLARACSRILDRFRFRFLASVKILGDMVTLTVFLHSFRLDFTRVLFGGVHVYSLSFMVQHLSSRKCGEIMVAC
jgi:hypothetical protein